MQQVIRKLLSLSKIKKLFIKKTIVVLVGLIILGSFTKEEDFIVSEKVNDYVISHSDLIINYLDSIDHVMLIENNPVKAQAYYTQARKHFKQIEFYTEYQFPFYSKYFINGPLVNKAELEYHFKTFVPHGFQVIETSLYSQDNDSKAQTHYELSLLKQSFQYIRTKSHGFKVGRTTLIDMQRFEIIRIMALYLNGYDGTINKNNIEECKYILSGFEMSLKFVISEEEGNEVVVLLNSSKKYLSQNSNYDTFNRLYFIIKFLKPLYEKLYDLYSKDALTKQTSYAINIRNKSFYGQSWFNKKYFSVVLKDSLLVNQQVELGKLLFFDPILSGNNQRACASCHNPDHGFSSNSDFNVSFDQESKLKRNTPSLINSVFQKSFFYDGRSLQLEDQAMEVLLNHHEMNALPEDIIYKLRQSEEYKIYFRRAFKGTEDTSITLYGILKSLSEFERTLVALNSRFDKYLRGDMNQLSREEIDGYNVFAGKGLCGSCHFFPLFNGLVPPFYTDNEFEVLGVLKKKGSKQLDSDSGRYHISKNNIHLRAFKTVGIRNIDQTGPYMHNGVFNTIDEVIDFYKKGGGNGLGITVSNQTLPFDSLQLSKKDITNLKKFLLSLTDKNLKVTPPKLLPIIDIKGLEKRKIGGNY